MHLQWWQQQKVVRTKRWPSCWILLEVELWLMDDGERRRSCPGKCVVKTFNFNQEGDHRRQTSFPFPFVAFTFWTTHRGSFSNLDIFPRHSLFNSVFWPYRAWCGGRNYYVLMFWSKKIFYSVMKCWKEVLSMFAIGFLCFWRIATSSRDNWSFYFPLACIHDTYR